MLELEMMRVDFHAGLALQRKQILEIALAEIAKIRDEDEDNDDDGNDPESNVNKERKAEDESGDDDDSGGMSANNVSNVWIRWMFKCCIVAQHQVSKLYR